MQFQIVDEKVLKAFLFRLEKGPWYHDTVKEHVKAV